MCSLSGVWTTAIPYPQKLLIIKELLLFFISLSNGPLFENSGSIKHLAVCLQRHQLQITGIQKRTLEVATPVKDCVNI